VCADWASDLRYGELQMDKTVWLELLLAGFFAVGCIRAHGPFGARRKIRFAEIFRMGGRLDRLRRSRWQWFSMVAIMLVLRLQHQLPLAIELMVGVMFIIFLALPVQALVRVGR
jgi:hypothetical protein